MSVPRPRTMTTVTAITVTLLKSPRQWLTTSSQSTGIDEWHNRKVDEQAFEEEKLYIKTQHAAREHAIDILMSPAYSRGPILRVLFLPPTLATGCALIPHIDPMATRSPSDSSIELQVTKQEILRPATILNMKISRKLYWHMPSLST